MDTNKWKSVAVRIEDYKILQAFCEQKYRKPAAMIGKLVNDGGALDNPSLKDFKMKMNPVQIREVKGV